MATQRSSQQGQSWHVRLGLAAVGILIGCAALVYSTLYYGLIHGEEFSPQVFKRRTFFYYEIPLLGVQVSPIKHTDQTGELETFLVKKKIVAVKKGNSARWDLVIARHGNVVASLGDARILVNYLDSIDAKDKEVWLAWTQKHMELGKVLWPEIADLARQELYIFIPDLLALARQASTPEQFKDELGQMLTKKYLALAQTQQSMGRHELAIDLYTHALAHSPQQLDALQGRAGSFKSVGKREKAAKDRDLARQIQGGS